MFARKKLHPFISIGSYYLSYASKLVKIMHLSASSTKKSLVQKTLRQF